MLLRVAQYVFKKTEKTSDDPNNLIEYFTALNASIFIHNIRQQTGAKILAAAGESTSQSVNDFQVPCIAKHYY